MAFKKRYRKRKPQYTVGGSVAHLAKRAMQGVMAIKKIVNVESKRLDFTQAASNVDYSGYNSADNLYGMSQGTTALTRTGDLIKLQNLRIRGELRGTGSVTSCVRVMLVRGHREADDAPTLANILNGTGAVSSYLENRTWNLTKNYTLLYDKTFTLSFPGDFHCVKHFDISYSPKLHHIKYVAGGTTAEDGGLYLICLSDRTATNLPTVTFISRMLFTDN